MPSPVPAARSRAERLLVQVFLLALHALPFTALITGASPRDLWAALLLTVLGQLTTTIGLHRYFSHHCFKTSRAFQFVLALLSSGAFVDPIGFAGKHRLHHRYSDTPADVHSPTQGLWFSWIASLWDDGRSDAEVLRAARDLTRFPELVWLHRLYFVPGVLLGLACYAIGGWSMFAIGFGLSRLGMLHTASAVNYFCHRFGSRRYPTRDNSRNNALIALITVGEGWHHNHHYYPPAARAGFYWWEFDPAWYTVKLLAALGLVWEVRDVPASVREGRKGAAHSAAQPELASELETG